MRDLIFWVILAVIAFVFLGIGLFLRNRSRSLIIVALTSIMLIVFVSLSLMVSRIGISVYEFYHFESCPNSSAECEAASHQQDFDARAPRLTFWMTIPKSLRPACETISPEFCTLEMTWDFSPIGYIVGLFGALIAIFIVLFGLRQKRENRIIVSDSGIAPT